MEYGLDFDHDQTLLAARATGKLNIFSDVENYFIFFFHIKTNDLAYGNLDNLNQ